MKGKETLSRSQIDLNTTDDNVEPTESLSTSTELNVWQTLKNFLISLYSLLFWDVFITRNIGPHSFWSH
jgi:hypothetical protein